MAGAEDRAVRSGSVRSQGVDEDAPEAENDALWCEECEHLVEPQYLEEGACPQCGTVLAETERRKIPWYFKSMIVASVIYLGWRAYQGISWLAHHG